MVVGVPRVGDACQCVTHHAPSVSEMDLHQILPLAWGGKDGPSVALCPTAHRNVHVLINLYVKNGGKPHGKELSQFSAYIRKLAEYAWKHRPGEPVTIPVYPEDGEVLIP